MGPKKIIVQKSHQDPIERLQGPIVEFLSRQTTSGLILMLTTLVALFWSNSPWSQSYHDLWHTPLSMMYGEWGLKKPLLLWINDGLMAIFFFLIGLEIKREILAGELASLQQAAGPIAAAIGGMVVPAAFYFLVNAGTPAANGWGVPMATDIAFALGILALLGKKTSLSAKIFLAALAIVDDIGATLVIAVVYTEQIHGDYLVAALAFLALMALVSRLGMRSIVGYSLIGLGLWYCCLKSGIHPTISGVLAALTIPARTRLNFRDYLANLDDIRKKFLQGQKPSKSRNLEDVQTFQDAVTTIEDMSAKTQTPLQRLEHLLHPWVAFLIMPIFALANAGVSLQVNPSDLLNHKISIGIFLGLFLGKQLGITGATWLVIKLNLAKLPADLNMKQVYGLSLLAGIGFTMSVFIANLAFLQPEELQIAKLSILIASIVSGSLGYALLVKNADRSR